MNDFLNELTKDFKDIRFYVLKFSKTTNFSSRIELQSRVRRVSPWQSRVVSRHPETSFIREATSEKLKESHRKAVSNAGLQLNQMITLGSDCPFRIRKFSDWLTSKRKKNQEREFLTLGHATSMVSTIFATRAYRL